MSERTAQSDRADLLADVAEMYFLDGKIQSEIAEAIGVTRSMVSRMLSEARQQGIVEIRIHRQIRPDRALASEIKERFGLLNAFVVANSYQDNRRLLQLLGAAAAHVLDEYLRPGLTVGVVWGTSMNATVDALAARNLAPIKVVQLSGALGARSDVYDGHAIVRRLALKLNGETFYLNSPLLADDRETAASFNSAPGVREAISLARQCDLALLGIGGVDPQSCSYCRSGNITLNQLNTLIDSGAVGVVYGKYFDIMGNPVPAEFYERIIGASFEDIMRIPIRVGVAGGPIKVRAVEGALRGGYINVLVTDSVTAAAILNS